MKKFIDNFFNRKEEDEDPFSYVLDSFKDIWFFGVGLIALILFWYGNITMELLFFVIVVWSFILSIIFICADCSERCKSLDTEDAKTVRKIRNRSLIKYFLAVLLILIIYFS